MLWFVPQRADTLVVGPVMKTWPFGEGRSVKNDASSGN
jgi:hypothetical protein